MIMKACMITASTCLLVACVAGFQRQSRPLPAPHLIVIVHTGVSPVANEVDSPSETSMLHMAKYCRVHGYQYRRYVMDSGIAVFHRPDLWSRLLSEFEVVVALDGSSVISSMSLNLNQLLSLWGFSANTLVLQPLADAVQDNLVLGPEGQSALLAHTSLTVMRNSPKVIQLLYEWHQCFLTATSCTAGLYLLSESEIWTVFVKPQLLASEWVDVPWREVADHVACRDEATMPHDAVPFIALTDIWRHVWQLYLREPAM